MYGIRENGAAFFRSGPGSVCSIFSNPDAGPARQPSPGNEPGLLSPETAEFFEGCTGPNRKNTSHHRTSMSCVLTSNPFGKIFPADNPLPVSPVLGDHAGMFSAGFGIEGGRKSRGPDRPAAPPRCRGSVMITGRRREVIVGGSGTEGNSTSHEMAENNHIHGEAAQKGDPI